MTLRDMVWDEALMLLKTEGKFRISDLPLESEGQRHTVRRTLKELEDKGWVRRTSKQSAIYRIGPKAKLLLDIDEAVIERAQD